MTYSKNQTDSIIDDAKNRVDEQSQALLKLLQDDELIRNNRVDRVRTTLVILSSKPMAFDVESIKQKVLMTYPESAVFFKSALGTPLGRKSPDKVDLLIDFTAPGTRHQGWFYARKLKRRARVSVGRNAGLFRKMIYTRIFDEVKNAAEVPADLFDRERYIQRKVMELAGVAVAQKGATPLDLGQSIALKLPSMAKL